MKQFTIIATTALLLFLTGCASPMPTVEIKPLSDSNATLDLGKYHIATVVPFECQNQGVKNKSIGEVFSKDLAWRLKNSYGPIFSEVNQSSPGNRIDELIVTGKLTQYDPGNRDLRILIGLTLGAASLDGNLILKDASDQHIVYETKFSKLWAWGGFLGGARGIEDMEIKTVAAMGNRIAAAKGWSPPATHGSENSAYSDYRASLPLLTTNKARIWVYVPHRMTGTMIEFYIRVDGAYVGTAVHNGFICVNVEPGRHEISTVGGGAAYGVKSANVDVDVAGGSEAYVSVLSETEQVSETKGTKEIARLHLKGY